ncbi:MAG: ABC transporter permease [Alphaproteobacteria bacterium]
MAYFVVKRLGQLLVVMWACSFILFVLTAASPARVEVNILGQFAVQAQYEILRETLRLDDPLLVRYTRWMGQIAGLNPHPLTDPELNEAIAGVEDLRGRGAGARTDLGLEDSRGEQYFLNFGYSMETRQPVNDFVWNRLGNTAMLAGFAFVMIVPISLIIGVFAGMKEGSLLDRTLSMTSVVTTSIPEFASAVFLLVIFVFTLRVLPGTSPLVDFTDWSLLQQLILPAAVLVLYDIGYVARIVRGSMVEVMTQPYIRTAILKGLKYREVITRHALRNAMIAPFTVLLLQISWLLTGVVVTEVVFAYPGLGRTILQAALFNDIEVLQATTLIAVIIAVGTQFVGDIGYMILNPRIRLT